MKRLFLLALFLAGCARPLEWRQIDGGAPDPQRLNVDATICQGEAQKARLSGGSTYVPTGDAFAQVNSGLDDLQRSIATQDVLTGCMASKGYILRRVASQP
jgi:hypothetical protein